MLAGAVDCCQGLFGEFLGQHVLEEEGVAEDVTTPHAAGLFQETVEPFETVVLPPSGGTRYGAGKEVEDGSDGAYMTVDVEF